MAQSNNVRHLRSATKPSPTNEHGKVPPRRVLNSERRSREYLTKQEVESLMKSARSIGRHGLRDATMILVAFRHGLRVSELVDLQWDAIDMKHGEVHISRLKNGVSNTHPMK